VWLRPSVTVVKPSVCGYDVTRCPQHPLLCCVVTALRMTEKMTVLR